MGKYYFNSYLNISTAFLPNHGVSFLTKRNPSWFPVIFPLKGKFNKRYKIYVKRLPFPFMMADEGLLFSRAWA